MLKSVKKCSIEGCNGQIWSKQLCLYHYNLQNTPKKLIRRDLRPKDSKVVSTPILKRKGLKKSKKGISKVSTKQRVKNEIKKAYNKKLMELYTQHWNLKEHKCQSCNKWLGLENSTIFHDHLLEKSTRKDLAFEMDNLFMVCGDCHQLKTDGFPTKVHKLAIDWAKLMFSIDANGEYFKDNFSKPLDKPLIL